MLSNEKSVNRIKTSSLVAFLLSFIKGESMKEFVIKETDIDNPKVLKAVKNRNEVVSKLCVKTASLWVASELIQSKLCPNRSISEVYEALKVKGKKKVLAEKPNLAKYLK